MKAKILLVEDNVETRNLLVEAFKNEKLQSNQYEVFEATDVAEVKDALAGPQPDVVLLDVVLPSGDGLTLLPQIKKQWPDTEVILMTGALDADEKLNTAVEATKRGAFHFLSKPFNLANLTVTVERALEHKQAGEERRTLREEIIATGGIRPVFKSAAMQAVIATVEKVAASDVSILITGETGTGKEVICNALHALSPRAKGADQGQLRRPAARTDRERVVRLGQRRVHRGARGPRRVVPPVRRRHAAAGRDFGNARGYAKQTVTHFAGQGSPARGRARGL